MAAWVDPSEVVENAPVDVIKVGEAQVAFGPWEQTLDLLFIYGFQGSVSSRGHSMQLSLAQLMKFVMIRSAAGSSITAFTVCLFHVQGFHIVVAWLER